jgi:hypothetical protein
MISETLNELGQLYGDKKILIGGNCMNNFSLPLPENIQTINSLSDFIEFLEKV